MVVLEHFSAHPSKYKHFPKAVPEWARRLLSAAAGAWKGTALDSDALWEKVSKKKSRKSAISL